MEFIKLNCPNCNGNIDFKEGETFKCPYCGTELMLKENNVYYIDQTINNYYGTTPPVNTTARPNLNLKALLIIPIVIIGALFGYFLLYGNQTEYGSHKEISVRTMPESEVLLFF
ncbi:hypothetical protein RE628_28045 [Paenibacillus sp. D2_2]|uniref:hypothetical protein n=1 Tax=Paenibacillus sp. D2_2 TaxID=3073092 RepID=UPI0028165801|nr:hypothetical protein [Paenibacillus sp. D2_2]WMT40886.1 hypothetical protein RE628_28045 [Paenibacillus sp. D2_2]